MLPCAYVGTGVVARTVPRASSAARNATVATVDSSTHAASSTSASLMQAVRWPSPSQAHSRSTSVRTTSSRAVYVPVGAILAQARQTGGRACRGRGVVWLWRRSERQRAPNTSRALTSSGQRCKMGTHPCHPLAPSPAAAVRARPPTLAHRRAREEHVHRGLGTNARAKI